MRGEVLVGTSGFSYKDWIGPFYPEGTPSGSMLQYYAERFPIVELDFTYYQMPGIRAIEGLARKVPENFLFAVKVYKGLTHEKVSDSSLFQDYRSRLAPIRDSGKLGCVLAQFPWGFKLTEENVRYVMRFKEEFPDDELIVEFRNNEWAIAQTYKFLKKYEMGFCCVDEPPLRGLMPAVAEVTSNIGYVRFHGRNSEKWWNSKDSSERYDYLYSNEELEEWVPKIEKLAKNTERTYVLFNNCHSGQAAMNAAMMQMILEGLEG